LLHCVRHDDHFTPFGVTQKSYNVLSQVRNILCSSL
jgi:hypothetical protein